MKHLYNYQITALTKSLQQHKFLLCLDMGLGKTFVAVNWLNNIKTNPSFLEYSHLNVLIVVTAFKLDDWYDECQQFISLKHATIIKGTKNDKKVFDSIKEQNNIFILSYQKLLSLSKKDLKFIKQKWILIMDESQNIKNTKSQITKLFLKNQNWFVKVLLLSGRPFSNGYIDLFPQMKLIDCFVNDFNFKKFHDWFVISVQPKNGYYKIIKGYKNVDALLKILNNNSYFLEAKNAFDLPKSRNIIINVESNKFYNLMKKDKALLIKNGTIMANNSMSLMHNLKMLSSGIIKIDDECLIVCKNKLNALEELINNSNYNFSIFYTYQCELYFIKQLINEKQINTFEINGQKNELKKGLQDAQNNRVIFLINYGSGAEGIDGLQYVIANQIYFSATWSGNLFAQSKKRIDRIGQTKKITYYFLITKNTIEQKIYKALEKSHDYTIKMFEQGEKIKWQK